MLHSPAIAEWDNDYARVARVASQLRTQGLASRSNKNKNYYNNNNNKTTTTVGGHHHHQQQQQFHLHLNRLDGALSTLPLAPAEIQRRRRLIHHLRGGTVGITAATTTTTNTRTHNSMSSTTSIDGFSSMGAAQQQQVSQMAAAMQQQDEMIDELAVGVSRLRDQTQVIGDEARMHVNLLGEMETNLAAAHSGLDEETKRAAKLKEDQSLWKLQLVVAGETILFVLLLFLGLSP
jgi:hypothetical protein